MSEAQASSAERINKCILTQPDLDILLQVTGGIHNAVLITVLSDRGVDMQWEKRSFPDKTAYSKFPVVQKGVVLLGENTVAVVQRADVDAHGPRISSGMSVVFGSSPDKSVQQVLDSKVEHEGIEVEGNVIDEVLAVNRLPDGRQYVFVVSGVRAASAQVLRGKKADKSISFFPVKDVLTVLSEQGRTMECNILRLLVEQMI